MSSVKDLLRGDVVDGSGTANYVSKWSDADTITNSVIYDDGTNIGIGTSSPSFPLDVYGGGGIRLRDDANLRFIRIIPANSTATNAPAQIDSSSSLGLAINVAGSETMRIDSSGRVGIGTSSPASLLSIQRGASGDNMEFIGSGASGYSDILFYNTSKAVRLGYIDWSNTQARWNVEANIPLILYTNATERMRITNVGYLKLTDIGSYNDVGRPENEIQGNQTVYRVLQLTGTNTGLIGEITQLRANRSSSSSYSYLAAYSLGSTDFDFRLRGDGIGYSDGGWTTPASDYAEYFETKSGNAISRGVTVVIDGEKVRPATESDDAFKIIGIIRPKEDGYTAGIVGGASNERWNKKYLTDDFGVYLKEEHNVIEWTETIIDEEGNEREEKHSYESHNIPDGIVIPDNATIKTHDEKGKKFTHRKLNPDYDESVEYIPREERDEWVIVGLLGQVPMLKGQPVNPNWIKMKDVSETVELWFIK